MFGDGKFAPPTKLPKPELAQSGPHVSKKEPELNVIKRLNPMRKVDQGKKIGHYHGLHIMSHFPKV